MPVVEMCNKSSSGPFKELEQLVSEEEEDQGYDAMSSQSGDGTKYH
jgi:hypothetical protein